MIIQLIEKYLPKYPITIVIYILPEVQKLDYALNTYIFLYSQVCLFQTDASSKIVTVLKEKAVAIEHRLA